MDELRFEDEAWSALSPRAWAVRQGRSLLGAYAGVTPAASVGLRGQEPHRAGGGAKATLYAEVPSDSGSGETSLTSYGFDKVLSRVANDSGIKGVIVRIDSPGGEVTASDENLAPDEPAEQEEADRDFHVRHGGVGRLLHGHDGRSDCGLSRTLTGSIGVVYGKPNLHGLYEKLGVTKNSIERGRHSDIDSDYTPLSPEERALLRQGIDESYSDFVSKVAAARRRPFDEIEPLAQGRVWLGSQAAARGLVLDQLGGLDAAVDLVKKKAGISSGERVAVEMYPEPASILDMLLKRSSPEDLLEARLTGVFGAIPFHAWMKGGYLRLMPYRVETR